MSKHDYFQDAIDWAKSLSLSNFKANTDGYDSPNTLSQTDTDLSFTPDMTGRRRTNKFYLEIALKSEDKRELVSKWKLLSTLASMKGGKLYLLAPSGHKAFTERILSSHQLPNTELVAL